MSWLAITQACQYQSDDRKADTNEVLAIMSQEFSPVAIHGGDEKFVKWVAILTLAGLELIRS